MVYQSINVSVKVCTKPLGACVWMYEGLWVCVCVCARSWENLFYFSERIVFLTKTHATVNPGNPPPPLPPPPPPSFIFYWQRLFRRCGMDRSPTSGPVLITVDTARSWPSWWRGAGLRTLPRGPILATSRSSWWSSTSEYRDRCKPQLPLTVGF